MLIANGIIRTARQLPDVSRTAVWGRAALCLAGASCDWWGGNIEKLIIPGCRIHKISAFGSGCSGCMAPQWNNTWIILTDARYPAIDAFYLVGTDAN